MSTNLIGIADAAKALAVSPFTVRRLIAAGEIKAVNVGARRLIPVMVSVAILVVALVVSIAAAHLRVLCALVAFFALARLIRGRRCGLPGCFLGGGRRFVGGLRGVDGPRPIGCRSGGSIASGRSGIVVVIIVWRQEKLVERHGCARRIGRPLRGTA